MDQQTETYFAQLKGALEGQEYGLPDLLHVIGEFAGSERPYVGAALANHARDILEELPDDQELSYNDLIAETYRRTFYDEEGSKKYGTQYMREDDMLGAFSEHMVRSYEMQRLQQTRSGILMEDAPGSH